MKCNNCNTKFEGNYCPKCGTKAMDKGADKVSEVKPTGLIKDSISMYGKTRFRFVFLGVFLTAICAFACKMIFAGIFFTIAGVLIMPWVIKRFSGKKRMIIIIVAIFLMILGAVEWMTIESETTIDYVKQYQDPDVSYSIGEIFGLTDMDIRWTYNKDDNAEYVVASYREMSDIIEVIFEISERTNKSPQLYDVLLNGESNVELLMGFNERMFGNSADLAFTPDQTILDNQLSENNSTNFSDSAWYMNYSLFEAANGARVEVYSQADVELCVTHYTQNGEIMSWYFDLEPAEIGSNGAMIYYYGKDLKLTYYPDNPHLEIESSMDEYQGEYWPS